MTESIIGPVPLTTRPIPPKTHPQNPNPHRTDSLRPSSKPLGTPPLLLRFLSLRIGFSSTLVCPHHHLDFNLFFIIAHLSDIPCLLYNDSTIKGVVNDLLHDVHSRIVSWLATSTRPRTRTWLENPVHLDPQPYKPARPLLP